MKRTLLLVALLSAACTDTPVSEPNAPGFTASPAQGLAAIQFARHTTSSNEERIAAVKATMTATLTIASTTTTWREAHAATQRVLDGATSELERASLEQATAKMMLTGYLNDQPDDPEAARVALSYAERLVERESPEAEVVLDAVATFGGVWPEAKTRAVAVGAAEAAETYVADGGMCADCERPPEAERALREMGQDPLTYEARQSRAAQRLRQAVQ